MGMQCIIGVSLRLRVAFPAVFPRRAMNHGTIYPTWCPCWSLLLSCLRLLSVSKTAFFDILLWLESIQHIQSNKGDLETTLKYYRAVFLIRFRRSRSQLFIEYEPISCLSTRYETYLKCSRGRERDSFLSLLSPSIIFCLSYINTRK